MCVHIISTISLLINKQIIKSKTLTNCETQAMFTVKNVLYKMWKCIRIEYLQNIAIQYLYALWKIKKDCMFIIIYVVVYFASYILNNLNFKSYLKWQLLKFKLF